MSRADVHSIRGDKGVWEGGFPGRLRLRHGFTFSWTLVWGGFQGFRGGGLPAVLMSAVPWFDLEKGQGWSSVCFAGKM